MISLAMLLEVRRSFFANSLKNSFTCVDARKPTVTLDSGTRGAFLTLLTKGITPVKNSVDKAKYVNYANGANGTY